MLKFNRGILAVPFVFFLNALPLSTAWAVSDEVAVQLLERLSELELEVNNLRGENETLRRELTAVRSSQRTGFLDVDKRVSTLEQRRLSNQAVTVNNQRNNQNSTALNSNTNNTNSGAMPALEAPVATAPLATPGTIVARPSPITLTPAAPAIEVTASANNGQASPQRNIQPSSENIAAQRRAVTPVNAGGTGQKKAQSDEVDPNSPESYYYYGTQDGNEAAANVSTSAGDVNTTAQVSLTAEKQAAIPDAHKAKAAYNQAYKLLVNDPVSAVPAFRSFMSDHPEHELIANAQYWLGEALYAQKDYSGATEEFMRVLKNHKGSPKAPGAALKLGYSFYELRQWDFARRTLEDTVRFFPDTNAAKLAANRLERMKSEGK